MADMKVWITKYALTSGIKEMEVEQSEYSPDMVHEEKWNYCYHGEGREWHKTLESAKIKAEEMRLKKIESLKNSLKSGRKRGSYDLYIFRDYPVLHCRMG